MAASKREMALWQALGLVALVMLVQVYLAGDRLAELSYGDFKSLLTAGTLSDVSVGTETIEGTLDLTGARALLPPDVYESLTRNADRQGRGEHVRVKVRRLDDPQLTAELDASGVRYTAAAESRWLMTLLSWIVPALIFVAFWSVILRRSGSGPMGSMMEIGRSKARVYVQSQTGVRFEDVAGIDEAKQELMEIVEFLRNPERYRRLGGKIPKGVLIVGAPGTGKTLLARAVAGEAGVPFLTISGSEFVEMFVGVGAARVRDLFDQAQERAPCIIFIDELDALGKARGYSAAGGHEEREQTLNQLLVEMDGFDANKGVIIMAATNRPEILDPALLRPGRFDRHVAIDRPDVKGREQILRVHTRGVTLDPGVDLAVLAAETAGFAGADLANIVNEAALRAARADKPAVAMIDFEEAIERVVAGLEKRKRVMSPKEKETVAYHEAGHALIGESRPSADRVSKISIIPRGIGALGFTRQLPTEDRYLLKRSELLDRLDVLLGGRVAEELVYHDVSTGAQDDLRRATDMARHMVVQYGMSESLGHVAFGSPARAALLDLAETPPIAGYSERTAQRIDEEITRLIEESHERVARTLLEKRAVLDTIARRLVEKEVLDRATLDALLAEARPLAAGGALPPAPAPRGLSGAAA